MEASVSPERVALQGSMDFSPQEAKPPSGPARSELVGGPEVVFTNDRVSLAVESEAL